MIDITRVRFSVEYLSVLVCYEHTQLTLTHDLLASEALPVLPATIGIYIVR